jgi:sigma-B regulation protein RsbQ
MDATRRHNVHDSGRPDGQPILFAHGYGCDQNMWRFVARRFEDTHRVVLFDYVGAGGSDLPSYSSSRYSTLDSYADDVLEICEELDLHDVIFVGHSVSAMIGVLAAVGRPDRFASLVLIGPSPRYIDDDSYVGGFSVADIDELLESLESNYLGWSSTMGPLIMGNPERPELSEELTVSFCRTDPVVARNFARVTFLSDNRADLPQVTTRTLVLQCASDAIAPRSVGEYVSAAIPDSRFVVLEASGHCPHLSAPDATADAIADFLAENAADSARHE